ncbi:MAG TPA: septation protein SepH [Streptosporangiaceae bacterium]|nr:septation protein SepH [Streptosporangiaceae bacterium]
MQELRLVAVSEDGSYAVLVVPGRSGRFALPIDERLRTVARGQFSRLAQYEIEVESPLRPKEIQDRIRAGETAEEIADAAGLAVDRIRRFEGPPLAERARWAQEAQRASVRSRAEAGPGPQLGEIVSERLAGIGATPDEAEWDSRKRPDGNWQVQLAYTVAGRMHMAEWVYDARSKHVTPDDDEAIRLCLDESQWPEPRPQARAPVTATVTPIGRAAGASHHADQRSEPDRPSGRALVHPSRQAPAAAAGAVRRPPPAALRMPSADVPPAPAEPASDPARMPVPAGRPAAADGDRQADSEPLSPASGEEAAALAPAAPARPAKRSSGRSRRSSVPSWDEIMFGNSRQPE